jgi:hypothetical protein
MVVVLAPGDAPGTLDLNQPATRRPGGKAHLLDLLEEVRGFLEFATLIRWAPRIPGVIPRSRDARLSCHDCILPFARRLGSEGPQR